MDIKKKNITIKDIAAEAGVAHSTVSLVMNNKGYVSEELRTRILKSAKKLGYEPNLIARGLISRKFPVLAAVFPEDPHFFAVAYFLGILAGIQDICRKNEKALMLFNTDQAQKDSYYQITRKWLSSLMIIVNIDYTKNIENNLRTLAKNDIPFVLINKYLGEEDVNYVCVDNYDGVYQAIEHLVDLGHKEIGMIKGNMNTPDGLERFEVFKEVLERFHLKYNPEWVFDGDFTVESGEKAGDEFLKLKQRPSAVFASNDDMAIGIMKKLQSRGLSVPRDVSLIGFDDNLQAGFLIPGLTTIKQPLFEMGQEAAKLVVNYNEEENHKTHHIILKPKLVIRESTASYSK
ncbi:LacI family transcriptional regulator [bacterium]|jgi:LacI family transcriptional regulator|nr:LacI family transcriptional regulator [bacterium]